MTTIAMIVGMMVVAAGCTVDVGPTRTPSSVGPVITIDAGLTPRLTPTEVEAIVTKAMPHSGLPGDVAAQILRPDRIVSMTATTAAGIEKLDPQTGHGDPPQPGIDWFVRAEGTFTNNRVPPGGGPMVSSTAFWIVSDADGGILGFGFP